MIVAPIGSYFLTLNIVFGGASLSSSFPCPSSADTLTNLGNSTYAGATAAVVANVVLVAYVVVAYNEDQSEQLEAKKDR